MPLVIFGPKHETGPLIVPLIGQQYKSLKYRGLSLTCEHPNNTVILSRSRVMVIKNILESNEQIFLIGKYYAKVMDLYVSPICSSKLNIFKAHNLSTHLYSCPLMDIVSKAFNMPISGLKERAIFFWLDGTARQYRKSNSRQFLSPIPSPPDRTVHQDCGANKNNPSSKIPLHRGGTW